jgi:hypothetical protein
MVMVECDVVGNDGLSEEARLKLPLPGSIHGLASRWAGQRVFLLQVRVCKLLRVLDMYNMPCLSV